MSVVGCQCSWSKGGKKEWGSDKPYMCFKDGNCMLSYMTPLLQGEFSEKVIKYNPQVICKWLIQNHILKILNVSLPKVLVYASTDL